MLIIGAATIMPLDLHLPIDRLCPVPCCCVGRGYAPYLAARLDCTHPHAPSPSSPNTMLTGVPTPVSGPIARASLCEPSCPCCQFVPVIKQPMPRGHNQPKPISRATAVQLARQFLHLPLGILYLGSWAHRCHGAQLWLQRLPRNSLALLLLLYLYSHH